MRKTLCIVLTLLVLAIQVPTLGEEAFRSAKAMGNFSEGYAAFSDENDQWGYIDRQGNVVIAPAWNLADCFIGGVARVGTADHLYGYINTAGEVIFPTCLLYTSYIRAICRAMESPSPTPSPFR